MPRKTIKKKTATKKRSGGWHLKVAYSLGKAAQKVTSTLDKGEGPSKERRARKKGKKVSTQVSLFEPLPGTSQEPLTPLLKEIKAIADISGLTAAIEEMNRISLKHSKHPVIERLVVKVKGLSPFEQEQLSRKFIERLNTTLYFNNAIAQLPSQVKLTEEDCEKMSTAFIECISESLEDIGLPEEDREVFKKLTGDIAKPINELMAFYMHPKTFGQKVKRLWRMQRILIRVIKLVRMTGALNGQMPKELFQGPGIAATAAKPSHNYWVNNGGA